MNTPWQNLLAMSASTFAGDSAPPYGFTTAFLARMREQNRETELAEHIGLRALLASLGVLMVALVLVVSAGSAADQSDFEPGVRSIVQVENVPVS